MFFSLLIKYKLCLCKPENSPWYFIFPHFLVPSPCNSSRLSFHAQWPPNCSLGKWQHLSMDVGTCLLPSRGRLHSVLNKAAGWTKLYSCNCCLFHWEDKPRFLRLLCLLISHFTGSYGGSATYLFPTHATHTCLGIQHQLLESSSHSHVHIFKITFFRL